MAQARLIIGILFCMLVGTVASAYANKQQYQKAQRHIMPLGPTRQICSTANAIIPLEPRCELKVGKTSDLLFAEQR